MQNELIIYPAIGMFALTFGMLMNLGISRLRAIRSREISIKYYQAYTEGEQTQRLHILGRHVQNHFEVPPLFYAAVLLLLITHGVGWLSVVLAWLFLALRCLHSVIHLGRNNVSHRFFCFGSSVLVLAGLWATLFIHVLTSI